MVLPREILEKNQCIKYKEGYLLDFLEGNIVKLINSGEQYMASAFNIYRVEHGCDILVLF